VKRPLVAEFWYTQRNVEVLRIAMRRPPRRYDRRHTGPAGATATRPAVRVRPARRTEWARSVGARICFVRGGRTCIWPGARRQLARVRRGHFGHFALARRAGRFR
jgi:hypothetical protein